MEAWFFVGRWKASGALCGCKHLLLFSDILAGACATSNL